MKNSDAFAQLVEHSEPDRPFQPPDVLGRFVETLDEFDGPLEMEAAWRLDAGVARKIRSSKKVHPPGGWRRFICLLAGTPWVSAKKDRFVVERIPEEGTAMRRELVCAFAQRLVPPTAAASMFIMLGLHPAWGVHLAHRMYNRSGRPSARKPEMFPEASMTVAARATFDFMSAVFGGLVEVGSGKRISEPTFQIFVLQAVEWASRVARKRWDEETGGLEPFLDKVGSEENRVGPLLVGELIDDVLVPSGVAERRGDHQFVVDASLLDSIDVGPKNHPSGGLERFLSADCAEVAS